MRWECKGITHSRSNNNNLNCCKGEASFIGCKAKQNLDSRLGYGIDDKYSNPKINQNKNHVKENKIRQKNKWKPYNSIS